MEKYCTKNNNNNSVVAEELTGYLRLYKDGRVERKQGTTVNIDETWISEDSTVSAKDIFFHHPSPTKYLRVFTPLKNQGNKEVMPVIIYVHGGGFCFNNAASEEYHVLCAKLAKTHNASVISLNYRLSPEHRLPAAYEDCWEALEWIGNSHSLANPEVFLMGDSAGGNIIHHIITDKAYHQAVDMEKKLGFRISGAIMLMPFFGGNEPTPSELSCPDDAFLSKRVCDCCWRMSLPAGSDFDHRFCNPKVLFDELREKDENLRRLSLPPILVIIGGLDLLRDRQEEYCEKLERLGACVEVCVVESAGHGLGSDETFHVVNERLSKFMKNHSCTRLCSRGDHHYWSETLPRTSRS